MRLLCVLGSLICGYFTRSKKWPRATEARHGTARLGTAHRGGGLSGPARLGPAQPGVLRLGTAQPPGQETAHPEELTW